MITILYIAVFITSISVVKIAIITVTQSSNAIATDIVAIWHGSVQEIPLVADTRVVALDLDVVEGGIAGDTC